jgi:hypothetical protein
MIRPIMLELGHDDSDNDHTAEHDHGSNQEHRLAANLVNYQLWNTISMCHLIVMRGEFTIAGTVLTKKTTPVTPVASSAMVPPVRPRLLKTLDA